MENNEIKREIICSFSEEEMWDLLEDKVFEKSLSSGRWSEYKLAVVEYNKKFYGVKWSKGLTEYQPNELSDTIIFEDMEVIKIEIKSIRLNKEIKTIDWIFKNSKEYKEYLEAEKSKTPLFKLNINNFDIGQDVTDSETGSKITIKQVLRLIEISYIISGNISISINAKSIFTLSSKHAGILIAKGKTKIQELVSTGNIDVFNRLFEVVCKK